jgi:uncharacterized protein DUF6788
MSSLFSKRKLLLLLSRHDRLLRQLLRHRPILRGSFHRVYTRCGKSNCWCAKKKKGHPHARLTWSEEGTMMTRKVGASEQKTVVKFTDAYKRFSQQRRQLTALEWQIQDRLNDYEKALTRETRKPLGLLPRRPRLSAKNQPTLQTGRAKPK